MWLPTVFSIGFLFASVHSAALPQSGSRLEHVRCPDQNHDGTEDPKAVPPNSLIDMSKIPTFNVIIVPKADWKEQFGPGGAAAAGSFTPKLRARDEEGSYGALALRDDTVLPRAPPRLFVAPGYRELALRGGLLMINGAAGVTGGALVNVAQFASQINNYWAGEHKLELNMLNFFLNKSVRPGYTRFNYPHIWSTLIGCARVKTRVTDILNSPGNLIGVDGNINRLKVILLQYGGPRQGSKWDPVLVAATGKYLELIQADYENVAYRIGVVLNDIAGFAGQDPLTTDTPGKDFIDFCSLLLNLAIGYTENFRGAVGTGNYHEVRTLTG